ncbi:hypothetical protein F5B20DRAFT_541391 [Whalleya microplaca]|nr:hypothetical protein F5B20DRAFT_541391 [Whalleya microplaca]
MEANNPFNRLPIELRWCILESVPDVQSLASAALACHAFYVAFIDKQDGLIKKVLINCIGLGSFREAVMAHQCFPPYLSVQVNKTRWPTAEQPQQPQQPQQQLLMYNYISDFLQRLERPSLPPSFPSDTWTMRDALTLSKFHLQVVSTLAKRLTHTCARESSTMCPLKDSFSSFPLSRSEEDRIARALYRFELFRKLFGCFTFFFEETHNQLHNIFFTKFGPLENAQLGCIHDLLGIEIETAVKAVAEHSMVEFDPDISIDDAPIQHILTLGLEKILEIVSCDTYEDRERLLIVEGMPPAKNTYFLHDALDSFCSLDLTEGIGKEIREAAPFFVDGDPGPAKVLEEDLKADMWTEDDEETFGIYDAFGVVSRKRGSLLWDHERLEAIGVLQSPAATESLKRSHSPPPFQPKSLAEAKAFWLKDLKSPFTMTASG